MSDFDVWEQVVCRINYEVNFQLTAAFFQSNSLCYSKRCSKMFLPSDIEQSPQSSLVCLYSKVENEVLSSS